MALSPAPQHGIHDVPVRFSGIGNSSGAPTRASHHARSRIAFAVLGTIVVAVACAGTQWGANIAYDDARDSFEDAAARAASAQHQLDERSTVLTATTDAAASISAADTGTLMSAEAKEALTTTLTDVAATASTATSLAAEPLPTADDKPTWAWELFGESMALNEQNEAVSAQRSDFEAARADAEDAAKAVSDAGANAVVSAAHAAAGFEAAHVSARNPDILALRDTAVALSEVTTVDASVADGYEKLEAAAAAMLSSEHAEISEKQGPLFEARTEAEAFARSLAPDVLLDFDWSQYVNGYGDGGGMGGLATWWYGDPGYATIELSNSVADFWPSARSQALIAHEVGHAISVKCQGMYDDSNSESIEAWATAWAISQGFTDVANGTSAYGAPPQDLIVAAAECR